VAGFFACLIISSTRARYDAFVHMRQNTLASILRDKLACIVQLKSLAFFHMVINFGDSLEMKHVYELC
jgi:hypothetical protein